MFSSADSLARPVATALQGLELLKLVDCRFVRNGYLGASCGEGPQGANLPDAAQIINGGFVVLRLPYRQS